MGTSVASEALNFLKIVMWRYLVGMSVASEPLNFLKIVICEL